MWFNLLWIVSTGKRPADKAGRITYMSSYREVTALLVKVQRLHNHRNNWKRNEKEKLIQTSFRESRAPTILSLNFKDDFWIVLTYHPLYQVLLEQCGKTCALLMILSHLWWAKIYSPSGSLWGKSKPRRPSSARDRHAETRNHNNENSSHYAVYKYWC